MKKFSLVLLILFLILSTALIKNSTKKIDDNIFVLEENLRSLKKEFENIKLENDYLSSAEKLLEYQKLYFENSLQKKSIDEIKSVEILKNKLKLNKLRISD